MPYIKADDGRREVLRQGGIALTAGELNYQLFYFIKHYNQSYQLANQIQTFVSNFLGDKPNYQKYNDMTGALVRCARELNRRLNINASFLTYIMNSYDERIANYEDLKIVENGDVE